MRAEGLQPGGWANGPGETYAVHDHAYDKVIVVERGSITFGVRASGEAYALTKGDRLELPAGTGHDAVVGPDGVACLEAHVAAGSLSRLARRPSGSW